VYFLYRKLLILVDNWPIFVKVISKFRRGAALAAEPIGPGGPQPVHFLALGGHPYL